MSLINTIGYIPAIIFPVATLAQLYHLIKVKNSQGVSVISWLAFSIGNASLFVYTEKYDEIQSIVGLLVTSILQVFIVLLVLKYRAKKP